jgi:hypothetical protein
MSGSEVIAFFGERLSPKESQSLESWLSTRSRILHLLKSDAFEIKEEAKLYGRTKTFTVSWHGHTHIVALSILRKKNTDVVEGQDEVVIDVDTEPCVDVLQLS